VTERGPVFVVIQKQLRGGKGGKIPARNCFSTLVPSSTKPDRGKGGEERIRRFSLICPGPVRREKEPYSYDRKDKRIREEE